MEEIWKDIPDYDGVYQVSNLGRVRSVKIKTASQINSGYLKVTLTKNGIEKPFLVHRLVASLFCENPRGCTTVNHLDENKTNNCADNLQWCTYKENSNYGTATQRMKASKGKPVLQCALSGEIISRFPSAIEAERQLGYDHSSISRCCLGKCKQYKGFIWKFE